MSSLPPSFRDAVIVTRELGIRDLWIDSLCIVQDDLDDWRKESAEMGRIYGMSFLTIIAAGASNSQVGVSSHELFDSHQLNYIQQTVPAPFL